jgi:hypothetical protein
MKHPFNGLFFASYLSFVLWFVYAISFYFSANTPVAEAAFLEVLQLLGLSAGLAALGALFVCAVCGSLFFLNVFSSRKPAVIKAVVFLLLFCLCLLVIENWFYSLFGFGLKTDDGTVLKIFFAAFAALLAYHAAGVVVYIAERLEVVSWWAIVLLAIVPQLSYWFLETGSQRLIASDRPVSEAKNAINVLLISADGVNAAAMSLYGQKRDTTPFLDSIADELMVFDNAYTNSANTTGSLTAVLTGRSPLVTRVVYPPDLLQDRSSLKSLPALMSPAVHLKTQWAVPHFANASEQGFLHAFERVNGRKMADSDELFSTLALSGMQSWFVKSIYHDQLGVLRDAFGLGELDNPYLQVAASASKESGTLGDEERLQGLLLDLRQATLSDRALFSQVHFMGSHGPMFHPVVRRFSAGVEQVKGWMKPFYLDSILEFDAKLKQIYEALSAAGQLDQTLLIIYSDHGSRWSVTQRIPLLIRLPGAKKAGRYNTNVQLLDVAPTVLAYLGETSPEWMTGSSLLTPEDIPPDRPLYVVSVAKSRKGSEGWVRANDATERFTDANNIDLIYCGQIARADVDTGKLAFRELPFGLSPPPCDRDLPSGLQESQLEEIYRLIGRQADI